MPLKTNSLSPPPAPAITETPRAGEQSGDTAQVKEMQPEQTRRAGERPALPTMADRDFDEFLSLVGGEIDAEGFRFWRCPRRRVAELKTIGPHGERGVERIEQGCPYVLTDNPSRMMDKPGRECLCTNRSRCVGGACGFVYGGAACQASLCGYPRRD